MGDFDFNDIVVEYNVKEITNANSELVDIEMYFRLAAIGASYHNGFGVELPIETSNVQIWESDLTAAELESGGTNATFVLFNDAFDLISQPEWSFVNTLQEEAYQEPYEFMLSLTLTSYIPVSSLEWEAPYNPFIFVNQERGKEVHVTGYPGTWQVDPSYFQTEDDNTVPGSSYYKTADNLPFGLMIPEPFLYPLERVDITDAYYFLGDWAESGGTRHTDWYVTDPENVDLNEVYQSSE